MSKKPNIIYIFSDQHRGDTLGCTMMTGQYVCEHGVWKNDIEANSKSPSHVRNIRDAGYHTALIGKTHLYSHGARGKMRNRNDQCYS